MSPDQPSNTPAPFEGRVIVASAEELAAVKYNADGLVPAIAQCADTGDILMMAWMNAESLAMTDRKSTRLNSSHMSESRMPSSA